jgi:ADP-ribose pyrophosphatase YjhB (NUDIX family)
MRAPLVLFVKAHVRGHVKKDGTIVSPYVTKKPAAIPHGTGPGQFSLFSSAQKPKADPPKGSVPHPRKNDDGHDVTINYPHKPSAVSTWDDPDAVATFVPNGAVPADLYGVPFKPWADAPTTAEGWQNVPGQIEIDEPDMVAPAGKTLSAGVVIEEPDGRFWITAPTNAFGGYRASWAKGTVEPGMSLQATAIRECFEETGLQVEITGFLDDVERTTSVARFSQALHLAPADKLYSLLNRDTDHGIAEAVGAGPVPEKPPAGKLF